MLDGSNVGFVEGRASGTQDGGAVGSDDEGATVETQVGPRVGSDDGKYVGKIVGFMTDSTVGSANPPLGTLMVGALVGRAVGTILGEDEVGLLLGDGEGRRVGAQVGDVGLAVGDMVGDVGLTDGDMVGVVGRAEGAIVGEVGRRDGTLGVLLGNAVGLSDGFEVGKMGVGSLVGSHDGMDVLGALVGV